ncbi:MAG: hypothetical protein A2Z95_03915 [Gallionellales bacterium GWA2_60_18]|nr:MAG: hypothetical protein A2Z95_03915 [Gallionellales bacterium GWA2_60_18]
MLRRSALLACLLVCAIAAQAQDALWLGRFDAEAATVPAPWQVIQLDAKVAPTRYRVTWWDGVLGVEASAERSMALLARPVEVDLERTPVLCWRWRVDAPLVKADLGTKAGDDYAARVYVSFALPPSEIGWVLRGKLALARSIYGDAVPDAALNYVWDNRYPVGTRRPNAYTDRAHIIVAESGAANAGRWVVARHDVRQDVIAEFGSHEARLIQLSVAADTDNTGETAHAGFADFHFVAKEAGCAFAP